MIGKDLDLQVLRADNAHLAQQLQEKDKMMKEWAKTADSWEVLVSFDVE
jgi:hypothetical protein